MAVPAEDALLEAPGAVRAILEEFDIVIGFEDQDVGGAGAFDPRTALFVATRGGAHMLGRPDCGSLEVGKRADFAVWDMADVFSLGAWDKVAALVLCPPPGARDVFVEGRAVVRDGDLVQSTRTEIRQSAQRSIERLMSTV